VERNWAGSTGGMRAWRQAAAQEGELAVVAGPPSTRFAELFAYRELDSTNDTARRLAALGAPEGLVVTAAHQRAGRGRLGRRWEAKAGANLLVSVLVAARVPPERRFLLTAIMALAARDACLEVAGATVALKWPNDLVVAPPGGALGKLGGILAEAVDAPALDAPGVVVGLGLNLAWPTASDAAAPPGATSLRAWVGRAPEPLEMLRVVLVALERRLLELEHPGGQARQAADYRAACTTLGAEVRVERFDGEVVGRAIDVTEEGHLVVAGSACLTVVAAGDVVHLRS
jgi:BirA family biotin operon repressor/biotin-[acetyl-CoA-carboxylase] ligase